MTIGSLNYCYLSRSHVYTLNITCILIISFINRCVNYIYEGQTLVLTCYVLSTIYYLLFLLEIVFDDEIEIVDESINEMK